MNELYSLHTFSNATTITVVALFFSLVIMTTAQTLANNCLQVFEGNNWTEVSIANTVKDLDYKQVTMLTEGSPNTIASLLHHLAYWNDIIARRLRGEEPEIPDSNGFDMEPINDEDAWQRLFLKTHLSFITLAEAMRKVDIEDFNKPANHGKSTIGKNVYGSVEHAYYHLGQIVILKHLVSRQPRQFREHQPM